jgi:hypothetical protein
VIDSNEIVQSWSERPKPDVSSQEERVLTTVFWHLLSGAPVTVEDLRGALGEPLDTLDHTLGVLEAKGCLRRSSAGAVIAAGGLMIDSSPHRLITNRGAVFTQCSVDAVGIPAALGLDAKIEDRCAHCGTPIEVSLSRSGAIAVTPRSAVIALAHAACCTEPGIPESGVPLMCQETNFLCSSAIMPPAAAVALGRTLWHRFAAREFSEEESRGCAESQSIMRDHH